MHGDFVNKLGKIKLESEAVVKLVVAILVLKPEAYPWLDLNNVASNSSFVGLSVDTGRLQLYFLSHITGQKLSPDQKM